jgi:Tol biopolymer transport system component
LSEQNSLSGILQVTDGFNRAGEARFSRDLRWIAFRAVPGAGGPARLYVAKLILDHRQLRGIERPICITPPDAHSASACFSPDGLSLIFVSDAGTTAATTTTTPSSSRIFRVDGWEGAIAMVNVATGIDLAQHPLVAGEDCSFSPDGRWICFTAGSGGARQICIMHADGSHPHSLTPPEDDDSQPSFSPDGTRLLYRSQRGGLPSQIFIADAVFDTMTELTGLSNEQALTHDQNENTNPAWHPDGRHIIYATSLHGRNNYELYLMDRAGRRKTRITFWPGADLMPVFSPDGQYLMWTSKRSPDGTDEVFVAAFAFPRGS